MKNNKILNIRNFFIIFWILSPISYWLTTFFSVFVILSFFSMFIFILISVINILKYNIHYGLKFFLPVFVSISLLFLLGQSKFYLQQGFKIHMAVVGDYLSKCNLKEFYVSKVKQEIGLCEIRNQRIFNDIIYIVYDSSKQIALPISMRDPAWHQAIKLLQNGDMLGSQELPTVNIIDKYYYVSTAMAVLD